MYKSCAEMRVKVRILIAEDEKPLADALTEILKQNRYHVDAVYHGNHGLEYARSGIYDLILLDIMLPGMDGLSILKTSARSILQPRSLFSPPNPRYPISLQV